MYHCIPEVASANPSSVILMELELNNSLRGFNLLVNQFISCKEIVKEEVETIDNIIQTISAYKNYFANSNKKGIDIVKVFSGLNVIERFLLFSKEHLLEGTRKKENPVSAEEIQPFIEDLIAISSEIDAFKLNPSRDMPSSINERSLYLREKLRKEFALPVSEELENLRDKNSKAIYKKFLNQIVQTI